MNPTATVFSLQPWSSHLLFPSYISLLTSIGDVVNFPIVLMNNKLGLRGQKVSLIVQVSRITHIRVCVHNTVVWASSSLHHVNFDP